MQIITNNAIWGIVFFLYYTFKDFFISKIFRKVEKPTPWYLAISGAILATFINSYFAVEYNEYLSMSYIKGSIQLPPIPLLILVSDATATILLITILFIKFGIKIFRSPLFRGAFSLLTLSMLWIVYTSILSNVWLQQTKKNLNWDYNCYKKQLAINTAVYYFDNDELPTSIEQITSQKTNPFNSAALILKPGSILSVSIIDEAGNTLFQGHRDLMGIKMYKDNPRDFFTIFAKENEIMCSGKLEIPDRYSPR